MKADEIKGKLESLDVEIQRYSSMVAALRTQIKTDCEKAPQDGVKKEAYEFVKASLYQELTAACRRYESLEECRLAIIFDSLAAEPAVEQPKEPSGSEKPVKTKEKKITPVEV